jgi:hypothetical protein
MWEKPPITSEFPYQYNLPSIKVNFVIYVTSAISRNEQKRQGTTRW